SRPDVAAALRGFGAAHGYDVTIPVPAGSRSVCVYAINKGSPDPNPLLGCAPVPSAPLGNFESAQTRLNAVRLTGWAIDPSTAASTRVQVYVDGASAGTFAASGNRPDVAAAYPDYGAAHGFVVDVPVSGGTHQICVNAVDKND